MRTIINVGGYGEGEMPQSEVCMHMKVAGKRMKFKLLRNMVQLLSHDGSNFSFPITTGEAGVYRDGEEFYYYN